MNTEYDVQAGEHSWTKSHKSAYGKLTRPPRQSASFVRYSHQNYRRLESGGGELTGLYMETGCGVDTAYHRDQWKDVAPIVEIVCIDFLERRQVDATRLPVIAPAAASTHQLSLL